MQLDASFTLLDCPGVVHKNKPSATEGEVAIEEYADSEDRQLASILQRVSFETLMSIYAIPSFTDADQFLSLIAKKYGKLKQGGRPMMETARKIVLKDWDTGKIPFQSKVPTAENQSLNNSKLFSQLAPEMNLD